MDTGKEEESMCLPHTLIKSAHGHWLCSGWAAGGERRVQQEFRSRSVDARWSL